MFRFRVWTLALVVVLPALAGAQAVDPEQSFNSGLNHLREGRGALAVEEFKKAVRQDAKNPYFQKGLGQAYLATHRFDEAISAFRKALELNPYYVDVRNDLGTVLIVSGKREEGRGELVRVFTDPMNPTPELTARNIAQSYVDEKDYANALIWYRSAIEKNDGYADGQLGLAEALLALKRNGEALVVLEAALRPTGDSAEVLVALAEMYQRAGKIAEARTALEKAVRQDPGGPAGLRASELLKALGQ
jgi:Flp pilus assembly protein TadD